MCRPVPSDPDVEWCAGQLSLARHRLSSVYSVELRGGLLPQSLHQPYVVMMALSYGRALMFPDSNIGYSHAGLSS
jgi:hypothetical protein